jgi:pimeloyl-ACP methyl ester carboxylesterase
VKFVRILLIVLGVLLLVLLVGPFLIPIPPLQDENWDRALWEFTMAAQPLDLGSQLGAVRLPTLVLTGDDDRLVATADTVRLAGKIPGARLVIVPACGHLPHEEKPEEFLRAVEGFASTVP